MQKQSNGFAMIESLIVACVVVVCVLGLHLILTHHHTDNHPANSTATNTQQTSVGTSGSSSYAVLSPATVPSKVAECDQNITFTSNGNSSPIQCANGDLNVTEWNALSALEPKVMTLGYKATAAQVQAALCSDVDANVSNPIELTVYHITSLYYGWHFSTNPSVVITNGTCVNVDD